MEDRNRKSIGLPGGPNEYITHISQVFSIEGYKRNSPDVNNPFNLIDSGNITMEGVDFPVLGTDNLGNQQLMIPGNNYQFPGDQVFEVPYMQFGGENPSATQVGVNPNANAKGRYLKDFTTTQVNPLSVINYTGPSNEGVISRQLPDEWYNTGKTDPTGNPIMERTEFIDVGPTTNAYLKNNVSVNIPGTIDEHEKMLKKLNRSNFTGSHGFRGRGWDTGLSDEAKALFKEENPFFEKGRVRTLDYDLTDVNNPKKKEAYSDSRIAYFADGGVPNFTEQTRMREGSYNKGKEEIIDSRFRKAQTGTEIKTYKNVNDILTYKNNPDWFDSRARYQDDQKYDDVIRRAIYSGKYGYDPKTKMLHPLAPEDQVAVSDKIKNIRAAEEKTITERDRVKAMSPEDQEADRKRKIASQLAAEGKTPMKVDEIGSRSNPLLREEDKTSSRPWEGKEGQTLWLTPEQTAAYNKDYVAKSNVAMAENPLFYAPGIIGASAFAPTALASLGDATYGALAPAFSAPLTIGGTSVPGATMSNAITAGFAGHGLTNVVPDAIEMYNNPSWANAGSLAIDALEIAPIVGAASQLTNEGLAAANKLGNKYLPNAYNYNPLAGRLNKYNRIVAEDAVDDFYKSGLVRTPQNLEKQKAGTINLNREGTTPYPSFGEGAPNIAENAYAQKIINKGETPYIISTDMPMGVSTLGRHGRGSTLFPVDASGKYLENFSAENAKIFEANPHWLKGYREVPKQLPNSPNVVSSADDVVKQPWQMQELPGLHLKSTMSDGAVSKIVEPKTGLVNVEQALGIIGKESGGADKVALIKQGLGETLPKKMDYNEFRKVVQDQLIPLKKQFSTENSNYGINRLGYNEENLTTTTVNDKIVHTLESDIIENQTLILGNKSKFGRGSSAHGNPDETLGHIHFLRDAETPDVLTVTQIQSDAFQGTHRIMPKNLDEALQKLKYLEKEIEETTPLFSDGLESSKKVLKNIDKHLEFEKANVENFTQKSLLDKNHQERYLQELVNYASKRGDINKVRLPTSETAAKVQGYNSQKVLNRKLYDAEVEKLKVSGNYTDDEIRNMSTRLRVNPDYFTPSFSPEHQTILKKYAEQPKTIKKLFGVEPKIVTDSKGNTWYEFDIPKGFKGEIKAFSDGGEIENHIMYKNYVNGNYEGTKQEKKASEIYDKLNRIYYKDAKKMEMSSPNYILTHIINKA